MVAESSPKLENQAQQTGAGNPWQSHRLSSPFESWVRRERTIEPTVIHNDAIRGALPPSRPPRRRPLPHLDAEVVPRQRDDCGGVGELHTVDSVTEAVTCAHVVQSFLAYLPSPKSST